MRNNPSLKSLLTPLLFVCALLVACSVSFSTANVGDAWLSADKEGQQRTSSFGQDAVVYAQVQVRNAPEDTRVRSVWYAVEAENVEPNFKFDEVTFTITQSGNPTVTFNRSNPPFWPRGRYKIEIYLNDATEPARTLEFQVQ